MPFIKRWTRQWEVSHLVLCSVNDLEASIGEYHADISSSEPSVLINCFLSLLGVLELAFKDIASPAADFSSWIYISGQVFHLWDVF